MFLFIKNFEAYFFYVIVNILLNYIGINMRQPQKTMAFDVDGVLLNFTKAFDESASLYLGRQVIAPLDHHNQTPYDIAKRAGVGYEEIDKILQFMLDTKKYDKFDALEGAADALERIKNENFRRIIVTALPESASEMRLKNLKDKLGFEPDDCFFVGMGKSKQSALLQANPDIFMDDRVKYLKQGSHVFHLAWVDQAEMQDDREFMVSTRVRSLAEWTDKHLLRISQQLDDKYHLNLPIQAEINFKNDLRYRPS